MCCCVVAAWTNASRCSFLGKYGVIAIRSRVYPPRSRLPQIDLRVLQKLRTSRAFLFFFFFFFFLLIDYTPCGLHLETSPPQSELCGLPSPPLIGHLLFHLRYTSPLYDNVDGATAPEWECRAGQWTLIWPQSGSGTQ